MKRQKPKSNIVGAILFILSSGLICALLGLILYFIFPDLLNSIFPTPSYTFRVLIADPIPVGVSDIQTLDLSFAFDTEVVGAFHATPEAIDEIIARNKMELEEFAYDPPYEYFPNINWNKDWKCYRKYIKEKILFLSIWVNPEKDSALFRFVDG